MSGQARPVPENPVGFAFQDGTEAITKKTRIFNILSGKRLPAA
jgi:hypothetical protein